MTTKHTGGPAFPVRLENGGDTTVSGFMGDAVNPGTFVVYGGLTIRDYFAAKALEGICASGPGMEWSDLRIARDAYALADSMLKVREES